MFSICCISSSSADDSQYEKNEEIIENSNSYILQSSGHEQKICSSSVVQVRKAENIVIQRPKSYQFSLLNSNNSRYQNMRIFMRKIDCLTCGEKYQNHIRKEPINTCLYAQQERLDLRCRNFSSKQTFCDID